jgi:cytochrome c-type biogenesis protein CcmE
MTVRFAITDTAKVIPVTYKGTLPDLFKEGKGAVVQGKLEGRRVPSHRGARQARRELHAAGGRPRRGTGQKAAQTVSQ